MAAFKNGDRVGVRAGVMIAMAKVDSDDEVKAAADYFAASCTFFRQNKQKGNGIIGSGIMFF